MPGIVCQPYEASAKNFYRWKALLKNHSGMIVVRLRNLELENRRLNQALADLSLDVRTLKVALSKSLH